MSTLATSLAVPRHRNAARAVFWVLAAIDVLGALGMVVFTSGITIAEVLLIVAAAAIGVIAALAFARSIEARAVGTRTVWIARGFGLVGAAITVWFPAILFGEMRYASPGVITPNEMVLGEIRAAAFGLVYGLIPIVVALRLPVAGGALFLANAAVGFVLGAFDPFGSFPERAVGPSIVMNTVPPLAIGLALILGGLAMRREPAEPPFGAWLRSLLRGSA